MAQAGGPDNRPQVRRSMAVRSSRHHSARRISRTWSGKPWRAAFPAHAAFFDAIITKMEKELAETRAMRVAAQPVESSRVARL